MCAWAAAVSAMYTVDDEGLEEDGAVVGCAFQFVDHDHWELLDAVSLWCLRRLSRRGASGTG